MFTTHISLNPRLPRPGEETKDTGVSAYGGTGWHTGAQKELAPPQQEAQIRGESAICSFRKRKSCSVPSLWGAPKVPHSSPTGPRLPARTSRPCADVLSQFPSVCREPVGQGLPRANTGLRKCLTTFSHFQASAASLQSSLPSNFSLSHHFFPSFIWRELTRGVRVQAWRPDD